MADSSLVIEFYPFTIVVFQWINLVFFGLWVAAHQSAELSFAAGIVYDLKFVCTHLISSDYLKKLEETPESNLDMLLLCESFHYLLFYFFADLLNMQYVSLAPYYALWRGWRLGRRYFFLNYPILGIFLLPTCTVTMIWKLFADRI